MHGAEALDLVAQDCRFVINRRGALQVAPELDRQIPSLTVIELIDAGAGRTQIGYPIVRSARLAAEVLRVLGTDVGRLLSNIDALPDGELLPTEALRADPFHRLVSDLLVRTHAQGGALRLESVFWLYLSKLVSSLLNFDRATLAFVARDFPEEAQKGERYLAELLRLKGSNLGHYAQLKMRVLRGFWQRIEHIQLGLGEVHTDAVPDPILGQLLGSAVLFSEKPEALYSFFDLREFFAVVQPRISLDDFTDLQRTLRSVIEDAFLAERSHRASVAEQWFVREFITDEVLEKAGRIELADGAGAVAPGEHEAFPSKVAWLLSLQEAPVRYLLHHLEHFPFLKSVTRRFELRKEFLKRLKTLDSLRDDLPAFATVQREILRWDLFNTARSFVREVDRIENRLVLDTRPLRASVTPFDLCSPKESVRRRRHGTVVVTDLSGFRQRVDEVFGGEGGQDGAVEFDPDFGALCLQHMFATRADLAAWKGRAGWFAGGRVVDFFPRALDAVRYVAASLERMDQARMVRPGVGEAPRINPFTHDIHVGIGTGEWFELHVPGEGHQGGAPRSATGGSILHECRQLVLDGPRGTLRGSTDEYDPLEIFRVKVEAGRIDNRGIAILERTWKELVAALRLEGITCWSPQNPEIRVAGRVPNLKNYRLDLIVEDPVTGQIIAGRKVDGLVELRSPRLAGRPVPVYEILFFRSDIFLSFLDRAADLARHQATLQSASNRKVPSSKSVPAVGAEPRRTRVQGAKGPGVESPIQSHGRLPAVDPPPAAPARKPSADKRGWSPPPPPPPTPAVSEFNLPSADDFQFGFGNAESSAIEERLGFHWSQPTAMPQQPAATGDDFFDVLAGLGGPEAPTHPPPPRGGGTEPSRPPVAGPTPADPFDWEAPGPAGLFEGAGPSIDDPALAATDPFAGPDDGAWGFELGEAFSASGLPAAAPIPAGLAAGGLGEGAGERSILGVVGAELAARIRALRGQTGPAAPASRAAAGGKAPPAPDFENVFRDYEWARTVAADGATTFVFGRRYRDVLFDVHRVAVPRGMEGRFELDDALVLFLRDKAQSHFVPQSLSYEGLPGAGATLRPLEPTRLARAYARMPS